MNYLINLPYGKKTQQATEHLNGEKIKEDGSK